MLYRDEKFPALEPGLFWGFLSALNSISKEIVGRDEELHEVELDNWKVLLISHAGEYAEFDRDTDPAFVVIADKYDNQDFVLKKVHKIREILGPYLVFLMSPLGKVSDIPIPSNVMEKVLNIIKYTQKFPEDVLKKLNLNRLLHQTSEFVKFSNIYLADVDEGILFVAESKRDIHCEPIADLFQVSPTKAQRNRLDPAMIHMLETRAIFLTLLSETPFNRDLFLETHVKTNEGNLSREGYAIKQISQNSDFYLLARFIYNPQYRDDVDAMIKNETDRIYEALSAAKLPSSSPV